MVARRLARLALSAGALAVLAVGDWLVLAAMVAGGTLSLASADARARFTRWGTR